MNVAAVSVVLCYVGFLFFFCFSCSAFSIIPFSAMFGNSPCQVGQILDMSYIDIEL